MGQASSVTVHASWPGPVFPCLAAATDRTYRIRPLRALPQESLALEERAAMKVRGPDQPLQRSPDSHYGYNLVLGVYRDCTGQVQNSYTLSTDFVHNARGYHL